MENQEQVTEPTATPEKQGKKRGPKMVDVKTLALEYVQGDAAATIEKITEMRAGGHFNRQHANALLEVVKRDREALEASLAKLFGGARRGPGRKIPKEGEVRPYLVQCVKQSAFIRIPVPGLAHGDEVTATFVNHGDGGKIVIGLSVSSEEVRAQRIADAVAAKERMAQARLEREGQARLPLVEAANGVEQPAVQAAAA